MIEVGSIVENTGFIQGRTKRWGSGHGLVLSLLADGKIARVFWASTQKSGFCSVVDLKVMA
tara:strand:- start:191 stop:373 length:183 start_codon:yes stop_codon:yes gene_type:complete